jgi:3-hydroxyisobutyrate dehydrogenase
MTNEKTVGVVGLGAMGLPMALHLAGTDGMIVRGFDISPARRELAAQGGVQPVDSAADAGAGADVVILSVRDGAQAESALFGPHGAASALAPGAVIILTSTIGADAARALNATIEERGLWFVDAPISGGPTRAGNGDLLIVVGGPDDSIEAVREILDLLSSTLTIVGPRIGDGQLLKVINQLLAGVHIAAAAEAVALAVAVGLDPSVVVNTLSTGAASSFMLADRGPRMVEALGGEPEVCSRVDIFVKDMGLVAALATQAHVPAPVAAAAGQLYLVAERAGLGVHDDSTIVRMLSHGSREEQG